MARTAISDRKFLEQHHGKWRVVVSVPVALQKRLRATKLKRSLNTDSLAIANQLKWKVVTEFRQLIHEATLDHDPKRSLAQEALEIAAARAKADADTETIDDAIYIRGDQLRGDPIAEVVDEVHGPQPVYDPEKERRAGLYVAMARGEATPLDFYHEQYLAQAITKRRTKGDDKRAIAYLRTWCEQNHVKPILQAINRKVATKFKDGLHTVAPGTNTTLNKYLSRLGQYWEWLEEREYVPDNPWRGMKKLNVAATPYNELERPFTDDEVVKLFAGPAPAKLRDVMLIAALTGARLDAIVDLKVKDCLDDRFLFKPQKREKKERAVPIHPLLRTLVRRRTKGKQGDDSLFPEWPYPKKVGSQRERSFKTSNAFTKYRREVGVDDVVSGRRRSRVNFHSFRRWFITKCEQADQPPHIIAVVVGHQKGREGETLGRYSGGPLFKQAQRCVNAVKLPNGARTDFSEKPKREKRKAA